MTTAAICATREVSWSPSYYRGEQYDADLGLYYLRARYYNPATGRFLSRDPLDGQAKDPASLHKYLYALGDPVNRLDPMGREAMIQTIFTTVSIQSPATAAEYGFALGLATAYTCYANTLVALAKYLYSSKPFGPLDVFCLAIAAGSGG